MKFKLQKQEPESYIAIGIVSTETDYKISWTLNELLGIQLSKVEDISQQNTKNNTISSFSTFIHGNDNELVKYVFIQNKSGNGYYLDELKNIDYLLFIIGEGNSLNNETLVQHIRKQPHITTVFLIDSSSIKNQNRIVQTIFPLLG